MPTASNGKLEDLAWNNFVGLLSDGGADAISLTKTCSYHLLFENCRYDPHIRTRHGLRLKQNSAW
jgi:hypothetical protein